MKVVLVPGTHAWDGKSDKKDWYTPGSPFLRALNEAGIEQVAPDRPYVWSTRLGGVGFGDDDLLVWKAAGENLYQYIVPPIAPDRRIPPSETFVVSHSHGLQVVLFACATGLQIDTFVDVAGPVRKDLMPIARAARRNIRRWVHIHAGKRDFMQWFGGLFDGHVGIVRAHKLAHKNVPVREADHSEVLHLPRHFSIIIDSLKGRDLDHGRE